MIAVYELLAFLLGICLSVQLVAALFGIIDLWCALRREYPVVLRRIGGWLMAISGSAWLLGKCYRPAFLWGVAAFVIFLVLQFLVWKRLAALPEPKSGRL